MLRGLKVKPKSNTPSLPQHPPEPSPTDSSSILSMARQEKMVSSSDYSQSLLSNLKKEQISSTTDEPEKFSTDSLSQQIKKPQKPIIFCEHCLDNKSFLQNTLIAIENTWHISLPTSGPLTNGHIWLIPNEHVVAITDIDDDEYEELINAKEKIISFFKENFGKEAIFVEIVRNIQECKHVVIECFPVNKEMSESCYGTVMQELNTADDEWTDNKKLILTKDQGIHGAVPPNFPYVFFDFSLKKGIAHVIENPRRFKNDFIINVLAENLGIELLYVRRKTSLSSIQLIRSEIEKKWVKFSLLP